MPTQPVVRIGARGSKLSLTQSGIVQRRIAAALGVDPDNAAEVERVAPLIPITTTGDRVQDRRLLEIGGKGLFTKEIEEALMDGRIDCAVHSMKDMPAELPEGLCIAAIPEREDPRDAFISRGPERLEDLTEGAILGTASLRRQAQCLHRRPDLEAKLLRGNVETRLGKLEAGEYDAILLAYSGLRRLGLGHLPKSLIDPKEAPPAPGQGALAVETRAADRDLPWAQALRCRPTTLAVAAERGALIALEGSCRTPIGAHAWLEGGTCKLIVEALSPDGKLRFRHSGEAELSQMADPEASARDLGLSLGLAVKEEAGDAIVL
ncbi:porphobilinogen deaminase [Phenylobacterium zucineum HLK1]|uniref:Porphobilinogen deaminase n=1 Tax=Phenylobacterium zucineum (strain HLK1) TaxID=450851 RepID=HEM3_PHEZH|nr:hydroxymethylbilane synthase [Phenylobacterium zucineum]B4RC21.1 RecName: Full=Porphobilinogen deaminase; Short=PBG; AltName: Full=Hydroxymethylbilane synthase; Short=HMBS; AltName: Full=Pre-uroporphyrinogen synthase [Phenylobacterium zucineum HLK1]ACG79814.1 porphobilinogen deaminase [Phenylobacterium zucineum HLK1]